MAPKTSTKKTAPVPDKAPEAQEAQENPEAPTESKEKALVTVKKAISKPIPEGHLSRTGTVEREVKRVLSDAGVKDVRVSAGFVEELSVQVNKKIVSLLEISHLIMQGSNRITLDEKFFDCTLSVIKAVNKSPELASIV